MTEPIVDILAIGAHPDDVEISAGGTLLLASKAGQKVAIAHMSHGEMGTRGDVATRRKEATAAAESLGACSMEFLGLPDGLLEANLETKKTLVTLIRRHRPKIILTHHPRDIHPDHIATGQAVKEAAFLAGLAKWDPDLPPWHTGRVLHFRSHTDFEAQLVVDVSAVVDEKEEAVRCYRSQFHRDDDASERATSISRPDFWIWWRGRMAESGERVGVAYGEAFETGGPIPTQDPAGLFDGYGKYRNS